MSESARVHRLEPPERPVRVVIDTDAANEVDDQFALAYALRSPERLTVEAVYAAPFARAPGPGQDRDRPWLAPTPAEGMARSHAEIYRVLDALGDAAPHPEVCPGAEEWLTGAGTGVASDAAADLVRRARGSAEPLYVVALGAPTNVASALLAAPDIAERVVVVWLGGNGSWWFPAAEYNLVQDVHASRVLLDSGVPLVHVPCRQVTEKLVTTPEEVERRVRGRGRIGAYLAGVYAAFDHPSPRMKQLWDVGPVAWLVRPAWCPSSLVPSPVLHADFSWGHDPTRHLIREVRDVDADAVLSDLFAKLPAG